MAKTSFIFNKLGYGLHLPNLPKPDYLILKKRCEDWNMTTVQVILLGLRAIDHLSSEVSESLAQQVMKDI